MKTIMCKGDRSQPKRNVPSLMKISLIFYEIWSIDWISSTWNRRFRPMKKKKQKFERISFRYFDRSMQLICGHSCDSTTHAYRESTVSVCLLHWISFNISEIQSPKCFRFIFISTESHLLCCEINLEIENKILK